MNSPAPARVVSLDVYRGFVMFLMAAELMELPVVAQHFPGNTFWEFIRSQTEHVLWTGCSLHDLIQPSFSFLVGVALPFSIASRMAKGQGTRQMTLHALWRAFALVMLGVLLRSIHHPQLYWTFEDTLSQIGLGYPLLFALGFVSQKGRWISLAVILIGYWLLFALYPAPGPGYDYTAAGAPADWAHHFTGFASHWNLNANAAWAFDRWFLNLFPRESVFIGHEEGYSTLSFIPTLGTMILGLIAGQWMREIKDTGALLERWLYAALAGIALGWGLHIAGVCPVIKKLWTPAWTLFSGGWCFLLLAVFHWITEARQWRGWAWPLIVLGRNSIAMYVLVHLVEEYWWHHVENWVGRAPFLIFGEAFETMLSGAATLLMLWLVMVFLHRKKWFIRL
jgi:heparan-alpha-glucosaminide N-acetyltransferase